MKFYLFLITLFTFANSEVKVKMNFSGEVGHEMVLSVYKNQKFLTNLIEGTLGQHECLVSNVAYVSTGDDVYTGNGRGTGYRGVCSKFVEINKDGKIDISYFRTGIYQEINPSLGLIVSAAPISYKFQDHWFLVSIKIEVISNHTEVIFKSNISAKYSIRDTKESELTDKRVLKIFSTLANTTR